MARTLVPAEELRTLKLYGGGEMIDLRGTPKGDHADVWTGSRLVPPLYGKRRVRQTVTISYCAEGWHSTSGSPEKTYGPELCSTLFDYVGSPGGHERFHAFHDEHPVLWIVRLRQGSRELRYPWCDPELPDEYRKLWSEVTG